MKLKSKRKFLILITALFLNIICIFTVFALKIQTSDWCIIGSFASIFLAALLSYRFSIRFYLYCVTYSFLAASIGSCANLYYYFDPYDLIIHYLSGVLLAGGGYQLIEYISAKHHTKTHHTICYLFAFFFSSACAAIWEIYEYFMDNLISSNMQGSNQNTMKDMLAGISGAVCFFIFAHIVKSAKRRRKL